MRFRVVGLASQRTPALSVTPRQSPDVPNSAKSSPSLGSNFAHLQAHDEQLLRLGMLAERYFAEDPNTCLLKLRQFSEVLAQMVASNVGVFERTDEGQYDLLNRLRDHGILPYEIHQLFDEVRRTGNAANHSLAGDHRTALATLKIAWQLGVWFHRTFGEPRFKSGPFVPPRPPSDESDELLAELDALAKELADYRAAHHEKSLQLGALEEQLKTAKDEQAFWESMATEAETEKVALQARLAAKQAEAAANPAQEVASLVRASTAAAADVHLDEASTRRLIDEQLRQAGWIVDSENLRFSTGARPQKGKNMAIAEWPTSTGPADYVLFVGLLPLGAVEAKRKNVNVSAALQQAKRYSRGFEPSGEIELHDRNWGTVGEFRLPFVFSTNGRPWLRQLSTHSGIWFCDLRRPDNLGDALQGWFSPEGLLARFKQDEVAAHERLAKEIFDYGFTVRQYQQAAILATEQAIGEGRRAILLAMATGTGKTKTCIALIYRLLKTKRFRRILFLVDRSALGEQAANAFKETRMESLQTFAGIFGIKELDQQRADSDTAVHLATVQGMVQRVLYPGEDSPPPAVDEYDCIIIDECHRGYLLDRELSETELRFRSFDDYVSKYRRVIDYFAAVKIGLTATPALHTTEIFGPPVFTYSYREAVIDGYLVDHDPPLQIRTELSENGIGWNRGAEIPVFNPQAQEIELFRTPDELKFEVEEFNRKVITEDFNRVVCEYLASEIDPAAPQKTLIFCANDAHADLVVKLLKIAFKNAYGSVDDDAVMKITGAADKPLHLIRRYKNELNPSVAVTVDLLTTGIDVPAICNLVFLRRVNSRILFDQMLGRATRLCPEIGKETFRVFDAVRLYEALQGLTAMTPVVVNPAISFSQLERELTGSHGEEAIALVRDQFVAKLQRKKRHLGDDGEHAFEIRAGMSPDAFLRELRDMPLERIADWFTSHPGLGEILDRRSPGATPRVFISDHEDGFLGAFPGFGSGKKPEDYLQEFSAFIKSKANEIPAILTILTRPRDLTRRELKELALLLDEAGYSDASLTAAWREMTNREIAARIIGYIRQAALGDPLVPFQERVDHALQTILASRSWSQPQRDWLKKLAAQTKANLLVDRDAIDDPSLLFKREGGGFNRLNKIFGGELETVLHQFNDAVWNQAQ